MELRLEPPASEYDCISREEHERLTRLYCADYWPGPEDEYPDDRFYGSTPWAED
jgi:hypothetical protein